VHGAVVTLSWWSSELADTSSRSPPHSDRHAPGECGGKAWRELWPVGAPADRLYVEALHDGDDDGLHLHDGELPADADAHAALEHWVPVGALRHEPAVVEPAVRPELGAVGAPHGLHAAHGVGVVGHPGAPGDERAVREHVVAGRELGVELHRREQPHALVQRRVHVVHVLELLRAGGGVAVSVVVSGDARDFVPDRGGHVGVVGEQQEEGGESRGDGVAAGQHEAHDDVPEVLVVVDGAHEARQEVVARGGGAELPALPDDLSGERVDEADGVAELPLLPDVE